jgi:hypothetical protein
MTEGPEFESWYDQGFTLPHIDQTDYGAIHWVQGYSGREVKLTLNFQLVARSRKLGSVHPLPPYVFMA